MLKTEDVLEILSIPLLGIIPGKRGSAARLQPRRAGDARTIPTSAPASAYFEAARRLRGETLAMSVPAERKGFMGRLFGRRAGMNLMSFFRRRSSAPVARERLQVLLAHERAVRRQVRSASPCCRRRSWR